MDILCPNIFVTWRPRTIMIVTQNTELVCVAMTLFLRPSAVGKFYFWIPILFSELKVNCNIL